MLLLGDVQTITSWQDARCKQAYEWHIQILHIFLIQKHIKHFLFRVTNQKIWILQDWNKFCHFSEKTEIEPGTFLTQRWASRRGWSAGPGVLMWLLTRQGSRGGASFDWRARPTCQIGKRESKRWGFALDRIRTNDLVMPGKERTSWVTDWIWIVYDVTGYIRTKAKFLLTKLNRERRAAGLQRLLTQMQRTPETVVRGRRRRPWGEE
jgi:hypothetical protein